MTKLSKNSRKPYFRAILGSFCPNLGKNEFYQKKGLSRTDKQTDRWADRQTTQILQNHPKDGGPITTESVTLDPDKILPVPENNYSISHLL